ncbi:uncharacterized protein M421DRAFT_77276 [Didymella exigua CBS 183.55]|uniref:Uncharacterized protein n=1 Tax=Didymella exigua CBS 183.55 TaxID=1150837 RepID=A0A6A5R4U6_9PLEO|nr:uncharacterized protein M421DRAFT_77276 [Didymella exigua CBS 183.55]KAF1922722.1 hypothetical protein M421DRAFT_77276 [Didymella exigua CBS 183.55]
MESPCIILSTEKRGSFTWKEGYEDVNDSDLETLLIISRETLYSLRSEVQARKLVLDPEQSSAVSECTEKVRKNVKNWSILERLDKKESELVDSAIKVLLSKQTTREGKCYQTFLRDVCCQCNRTLVMLCAASLGKHRIASLNAQDRTSLLQYLKQNQKALSSPALDSLAKKHQIPEKTGESSPPTRNIVANSSFKMQSLIGRGNYTHVA